jgi:hypothetical protein
MESFYLIQNVGSESNIEMPNVFKYQFREGLICMRRYKQKLFFPAARKTLIRKIVLQHYGINS